jgi:hypothetical protein
MASAGNIVAFRFATNEKPHDRFDLSKRMRSPHPSCEYPGTVSQHAVMLFTAHSGAIF